MDSEQLEEISVRKAQLKDVEQICLVHITSVRVLCANDYTPKQIEAWVGKLTPKRHREAMEETGEIMFVAEKGKEIIGFSSLFEDELCAVYVHPNYARQGVGTLLLNAVETEAISQKIEKLEFSASINAKLFYQRRGYKVVERSFHTLRSGIIIPCFLMEKYLLSSGDR